MSATTDDPVDSLEYHRMIRDDASWTIAVIPAFRPDKAIGVNNPKAFNTYMEQLGKAADMDIASFADLIKALDKRHQFFHDHGCRFSDHALERTIGSFTSKSEIDSLFVKIRKGDQLNPGEIGLLQSAIMLELGKMNVRRGWVMQLHIAALRNTNTFLFNRIGPGAGGAIACFVVYDLVRRFSKNKKEWGTGIPEGIAAPESANNGTTGGALVPLLTLGIPGDAVTAVMLGALMLVGLQPGPFLFI